MIDILTVLPCSAFNFLTSSCLAGKISAKRSFKVYSELIKKQFVSIDAEYIIKLVIFLMNHWVMKKWYILVP